MRRKERRDALNCEAQSSTRRADGTKLILPEFTRTASMTGAIRTSRDSDARIGYSNSTYFKGEREMSLRFARLATGVLVAAVVVLISGRSWAVFHSLGPSKNEWGLKYDVEVNAADGDKLNVVFTLADQGRLKPIYSATVVAFSNPRSDGGRTYLANAPIDLKSTKDSKLTGQAQIRKEFADRAMIRILTLMVDGRRQTSGAAYYNIPLQKFLNKAPVAALPQSPPSIASPPASKDTK